MNRSDSTASLLAYAGALAILAAQVGSRATRDALYLSTFEVETLPRMMLASAAVSLGSALLMARLLGRFHPDRVVPAVFAVSASLFVAEWFLARAAPELAPIVLYLHVGALGAVLISGFWSVLNERFDPYTGKTVLGHTAAFAALGGVLGGLSAERIGALYGAPAMLIFLSALPALCAA